MLWVVVLVVDKTGKKYGMLFVEKDFQDIKIIEHIINVSVNVEMKQLSMVEI